MPETPEAAVVTDNHDGSLTLRLSRQRTITLPEPTALQYATIWDIITKADAALPVVELMDPAEVTAESVEGRRVQLENRRNVERSASSPHGAAVVEIVQMLTGKELTLDDLHRHALRPIVCAAMLTAWEAPLGGLDDDGTLAPALPVPVPLVLPSDLDSPEDEPSSPDGTDSSSPSIPEPSTG